MSSTTSTFSTISPLTVEVEVSPQSYNSYTIGQSVVGIIINLMIVIWLKMAFEQKLIYRILMVESVVNLVGFFGFVIIGTHMHPELIMENKLNRVMTYHFEIPRSSRFQKCKNQNQGAPSCGDSYLHFLGHKIKSSPILVILVPNNTHGTLIMPTKY